MISPNRLKLRNKLIRRPRRKPDYPLKRQEFAGSVVTRDGADYVVIQGGWCDIGSEDPEDRVTLIGFLVAPVLPDGTLGRMRVMRIFHEQLQTARVWKGRPIHG